MNRNLLLFAALMPLSLLRAHGTAGNPQMNSAYEIHRQRAVQMNELAGKIRSPNDSRRFVDMVAETFADELPPAWSTQTIRDRVAHAEYESAIDPVRLVPEQRIADAWNKYVEEIGAPQETRVSVAEIHNLRDGQYATARFMWSRGSQSIWTIPNIYAVGPDEKLADGCRAVEALRVVWDMANQFENLRSARDRVQKGIVVSDMFKQQLEAPASRPTQSGVRIQVGVRDNPVEVAEMRYFREHGATGLSQVIERLIYGLYPQQFQG
jgi:hypothetical protein